MHHTATSIQRWFLHIIYSSIAYIKEGGRMMTEELGMHTFEMMENLSAAPMRCIPYCHQQFFRCGRARKWVVTQAIPDSWTSWGWVCEQCGGCNRILDSRLISKKHYKGKIQAFKTIGTFLGPFIKKTNKCVVIAFPILKYTGWFFLSWHPVFNIKLS